MLSLKDAYIALGTTKTLNVTACTEYANFYVFHLAGADGKKLFMKDPAVDKKTGKVFPFNPVIFTGDLVANPKEHTEGWK